MKLLQENCSSRSKINKTVPKLLLSNFCEKKNKTIVEDKKFHREPVELSFPIAKALKEGATQPTIRTSLRRIKINERRNNGNC